MNFCLCDCIVKGGTVDKFRLLFTIQRVVLQGIAVFAISRVIWFLWEGEAVSDMKLRKVILGTLIPCILMFPIQTFAGGTLSGIGLLASEEREDKPDIYQVTLPTGNDLGIILDPEGLMSISEKGEYDSSWAGMIHMTEDGGALFVNRSSFPVRIRVGIAIEQDAKGTPSTIALLESDDYVDEGGWPQMYLTATPGASKIQSMSEFTASDTEIPILAEKDHEMTTFSFLLQAADYVLNEDTGEYMLADYADNYDSASFVLGGRVNRNADWSAYVGENRERVIIHAVYTIQKQETYDEGTLRQAEEGMRAPHGLLEEGY